MQPPFSEQFQDVYFRAQNGLAEKRLVFLDGNDLPRRFEGRSDFVVVEAGFGTGLSFLATAQLFLSKTRDDQILHFITIEKYPLNKDQIRAALAPCRDELGGLIDDLLGALPTPLPGPHIVPFHPRIRLTMIYDDIREALTMIDRPVDAWILDGFTPAKNPEMWGDDLFAAMAGLSATNATAATYSAARVVKDGLGQAGFAVERVPGFGFKFHRLVAHKTSPGRAPLVTRRAQRVLIYGGGLAGTAAAWVLRQRGHQPTILAPQGLADAASGNPRGLYNPRLAPHLSSAAQFYTTAYGQFLDFLNHHPPEQTGWQNTGVLHLARHPENRQKAQGPVTTWGWGTDHAVWLNAQEATDRAGTEIRDEALWLPQGGSVNPRLVCTHYAEGVPLVTTLPNLDDFDAVVWAHGLAALDHRAAAHLPLRPVRGQITQIRPQPSSRALRTVICYGGYITPAYEGTHVIGATFDRGETDLTPSPQADQTNLANLSSHVRDLGESFSITGSRVGVRVATLDHAPVVGELDSGIYASLGHGSHGLVSTHLTALMLADKIEGMSPTLAPDVQKIIDPHRFSARKIPKV